MYNAMYLRACASVDDKKTIKHPTIKPTNTIFCMFVRFSGTVMN